MTYCYECGEKVAENDVFCPFCGISLSPTAAASEDATSFDKTIVIDTPSPAAVRENSNSGLPPAEEIIHASESKEAVSNSEKTLTIEQMPANTGNFSAENTSGNVNVNTDSSEILSERFGRAAFPVEEKIQSVPPVINDPDSSAQKTSESAEIPVYENGLKPEKIEVLEPLVEENDLGEAPDCGTNQVEQNKTGTDELDTEPNFDFSESSEQADDENQNESSLMSYEEADVKSVLSAEEPEKSFDVDSFDRISEEEASSADSAPEDLSLSDFDVKEDVSAEVEDFQQTPENSVSEQEISEISNEASEVNAENAENEFSEPAEDFIEPTPNLESPDEFDQPIAPPSEQLPEAVLPPPIFDSVRIMETREESEEKASQISTAPNFEENQTPAAAASEEVSQQSKDFKKSYTTPNIGEHDTDGKKSQKLKPLDEGTVLGGRYEIVRKIGGGGMGAVYLASDKNLGGVLRAVKEMVQSYIEDEQQEKAINDFKRESLLLTSLDHQSIPTIFDYFYDEKEGRFYLVMKYISGGDLAARLRSAPEGRIDEAEVTKWAIQIADVLDYLHNRQPPIVYRDLKPANIMIDGNSGRAMVIDFGIARWVNKEEKGVTAVGTMGYAPPELFSGNVEPRSDIYSLGSTIFHLLTGADPQSNPLLIFDFQKNPRPRQINPHLSDQMERILMRSVEYSAEKRFASAAEMRQALEDHLANLKSNKATFGVKAVPASVGLADQPVFCGFCGQKIVATDLFCAFCGAKQPLAQKGVSLSARTSLTRLRFDWKKTKIWLAGATRCPIFFLKLIYRNSIRRQKFRAATHASGATETNIWSRI
jgi:serine/threonine-protein kinase